MELTVDGWQWRVVGAKGLPALGGCRRWSPARRFTAGEGLRASGNGFDGGNEGGWMEDLCRLVSLLGEVMEGRWWSVEVADQGGWPETRDWPGCRRTTAGVVRQ